MRTRRDKEDGPVISIKKLAKVLSVSLVALVIMATPMGEKELSVPEKIMESVVYVNGSSGVVIHSDLDHSIILTAYHVVRGHAVSDITISYLVSGGKISYTAVSIIGHEGLDLALVEIKPGRILYYSKLATKYPEIGDDIWTGSNQNGLYRSLKKGVLSSKTNSCDDGVCKWEVSGPAVFGSSGGGIFDSDGNLFGTVSSMLMLGPYYCNKAWEQNEKTGEMIFLGYNCMNLPLYHIIFVVSPLDIKNFILSTSFSDHFNYLE